MKTLRNKLLGGWILALLILFSSTQCTDSAGLDEQVLSGNEKGELAVQTGELTEAEIESIRFMREEEKLARDVYLYLYEIYPLRPFEKISSSEQAHMDAIDYLIITYQLEDPVGENAVGVFQNEELQELYIKLIAQGSTSREEALKVGALIEEVDIMDLQTDLDSIGQNEDLVRVYTNLCNASKNHLRAFTRVLNNYGVVYTPVKLSQEEYDRILEE